MSVQSFPDGCGYPGCSTRDGSTGGFTNHTTQERCPKREEDFQKARELGFF